MIDAPDRSLFTRRPPRLPRHGPPRPRRRDRAALDDHERDGIVEREAWEKAGAAGLLCPQVPEAYGGPGLDFSFNAIVGEELSYMGSAAGFTLQSDIVADYLVHYGSEEQKRATCPAWSPERRSAPSP